MINRTKANFKRFRVFFKHGTNIYIHILTTKDIFLNFFKNLKIWMKFWTVFVPNTILRVLITESKVDKYFLEFSRTKLAGEGTKVHIK